ELLAPRGRLDAAPRFVRWSTTQRAVRVRVRVRNRDGELLFERVEGRPGERLMDEARARRVQLTPEERGQWEAAVVATIEVDAMSADGELVATSDRVAAWIGRAEAQPNRFPPR